MNLVPLLREKILYDKVVGTLPFLLCVSTPIDPAGFDRVAVPSTVHHEPRVGVTKPILSVPLFSHYFRLMKTVVTWMISSSYLAGVTAAELRRHLANMNEFKVSNLGFWWIQISRNGEMNERSFSNPHPRTMTTRPKGYLRGQHTV